MRVIMPAIIDQADRKFNVDEADGVNRRHTIELPAAGQIVQLPEVGGLHHRYIRRAA
jgi:hypothetical protein